MDDQDSAPNKVYPPPFSLRLGEQERAGGRQMALHLLNGDQNEHVTVHQVRGFMSSSMCTAKSMR